MKKSDIHPKIKKALKELMDLEPTHFGNIKSEFDSLDYVEFIMALEEEFDLEIPDEIAESIADDKVVSISSMTEKLYNYFNGIDEKCSEWIPSIGDVCYIAVYEKGEWKTPYKHKFVINYIGHSVVVATSYQTPREVEFVFKEQLKFIKSEEHERNLWIEKASKYFHEASNGVIDDSAFGAIYDNMVKKVPL
jgi:acyl carrier protein